MSRTIGYMIWALVLTVYIGMVVAVYKGLETVQPNVQKIIGGDLWTK